MKTLTQYLSTFECILSLLGDRNLVIGGSFALRLHGLRTGKAPKDLDMIIYNPTNRQEQELHKLEKFNLNKLDSEKTTDGYIKRRMKFKRDGCEMDILIEETDVQHDLLFYSFRNSIYKVQSVQGVIDAKVSYIVKEDKEKRTPNYARLKDVIDLMELKNLNFNL